MKKLFSVFIICIILISSGSVVFADETVAEVVSYALTEYGETVKASEDAKIFPIASVSKVFTAVLVMKLTDEGAISLDGKVTDYIPEFSMNDERYKDISVRMLLDHTSGLFGSTIKNTVLYNDKDTENHDNFLIMLKEQRLKYAPGTMAVYCNDGYTLLELIIEKVTGVSYTEYLRSVFGDGLKTAQTLEGFYEEVINSMGSCGIYSDALTLCLNMSDIFFGGNVISADSVKHILTSRDNALPGEYYGLGFDNISAYPFDRYGIKAVSKCGDGVNYHSAVVILPEYGICTTVIMKGGDSRTAEAKASSMIIGYLNEKFRLNVEFYDYEKPECEYAVSTEELKKYEGIYLSGIGRYIFKTENNVGLLGNLDTGSVTRLKYLGNGYFDAGKGVLYFKELLGNTYIIHEGITKTEECEGYKFFDYYGVKVSDAGISSPEWSSRNGKLYFICDEKYTSLVHSQGISYISVNIDDALPGYVGYRIIRDSDTAVADIALPGAYGKDLSDLEVFSENGKEYILARGKKFVEASSFAAIYNGEKSICTILPEGYTRWFRTGEAEGRKISASVKGNGAFYVYNFSGECVYSSLTGVDGMILPRNGYIAFSGDAGTVFEITLA